MPDKFMSITKIKEVAGLMAANVRGGTVAKRSTEDEIAMFVEEGKNVKKQRKWIKL